MTYTRMISVKLEQDDFDWLEKQANESDIGIAEQIRLCIKQSMKLDGDK